MDKLIVKHEGHEYSLWREGADGVPRAKDLDVAAWLEYAKPHNIRRLIETHRSSLGDLFSAKEKSAGRTGTTHYLTQEQVLFLVGKSETPKATQIYKLIIQVFLQVVSGRTSNDPAVLERLDALQRQVQEQQAQLRALANPDQVIGAELARGVLQRIQQIAAFRAVVHRERTLASLRSLEEQELRGVVGLPADVPWRLLSVYAYPRMQAELHRRERRARKDAEERDGARQEGLRL